jgi:hypothetical protein
MAEICTWDQVFTSKNYVILYWYLFNKPSYQRMIAKDMEELKKSEEFKEYIPPTLIYENNITTYLRDMEESNLIAVRNIEGRKHFYQALSFFYLDPFCIKTPESKKKFIKDHFKEYSEYLINMNIEKSDQFDERAKTIMWRDIWESWSSQAFKFNRKNNSVIPAQKVFQEYSSEPKEFMKMISHSNVDYITLFELIEECFNEICGLCRLQSAWVDEKPNYWEAFEMDDFEEAKSIKNGFATENISDFKMLNQTKLYNDLVQNTPTLIEQYHIDDWINGQMQELLFELDELFSAEWGYYFDEVGPMEKKCWDILWGHASNARATVRDQLRLYQHIIRGNIQFNKETLSFEGL